MKKNSLVISLLLAISLFSCNTLRSTTYIEPQKSFVLGEGKHGSYSAKIQNVGEPDLAIFQISTKGERLPLGVLKKDEKKSFKAAPNTTLIIANNGLTKGAAKIVAAGDTNLSMGYKENK